MTSEYDAVIKNQKQSGIAEPAEGPAKGVEFYLPYKPVVREMAKTTKVRIVNASAKETRTIQYNTIKKYFSTVESSVHIQG